MASSESLQTQLWPSEVQLSEQKEIFNFVHQQSQNGRHLLCSLVQYVIKVQCRLKQDEHGHKLENNGQL